MLVKLSAMLVLLEAFVLSWISMIFIFRGLRSYSNFVVQILVAKLNP